MTVSSVVATVEHLGHAVGGVRRQHHQEIIRQGRERFIEAVAASLPSADPRASAHLVLALVSGMLLHHVSAPDPTLDAAAPGLILAGGTAALVWPFPDEP